MAQNPHNIYSVSAGNPSPGLQQATQQMSPADWLTYMQAVGGFNNPAPQPGQMANSVLINAIMQALSGKR